MDMAWIDVRKKAVRIEISSATSSKAARTAAPPPTALAGSGRLQWRAVGFPGNSGHTSRALSHNVTT